MITFRCEIQLTPGTTFLDIWESFCIWRCNSKFSSPNERNWIAENKKELKTEQVTFDSQKNNKSTIIEKFFSEQHGLFCIRYIQNEGRKTFITIIIVNQELHSLSYTMEELPYEKKENKKKNFIPKPKFFVVIDAFIDKKYVPLDFRGNPLSFTPNIFVSQNIPDECFKFLQEKYKHTANIRIDYRIKQTNTELKTPEIIEKEQDLNKKSSYFITSKKNFDFVDKKLTWAYLASSQTSAMVLF